MMSVKQTCGHYNTLEMRTICSSGQAPLDICLLDGLAVSHEAKQAALAHICVYVAARTGTEVLENDCRGTCKDCSVDHRM